MPMPGPSTSSRFNVARLGESGDPCCCICCSADMRCFNVARLGESGDPGTLREAARPRIASTWPDSVSREISSSTASCAASRCFNVARLGESGDQAQRCRTGLEARSFNVARLGESGDPPHPAARAGANSRFNVARLGESGDRRSAAATCVESLASTWPDSVSREIETALERFDPAVIASTWPDSVSREITPRSPPFDLIRVASTWPDSVSREIRKHAGGAEGQRQGASTWPDSVSREIVWTGPLRDVERP